MSMAAGNVVHPDWSARPAAFRRADRPESVALRLEGVAKRFGATSVLEGIDLTVAAGEFLAIVGHSGCGKSTLLRLIAGLDTPSAGTILAESAGRGGESRMMFQDARLLPWRRVLDNVAIGRRDAAWREAARAALDRVGLAGKAEEWPAVLSGGERQRVALARALVSQPGLLLLDEPLGALDALTRLEMQELVSRVWRAQGFTAVLVTHDVAEAVTLADRVVVLSSGRIAETWTVDLPHPRPRAGAERGATEAAILARLLGGRAEQ